MGHHVVRPILGLWDHDITELLSAECHPRMLFVTVTTLMVTAFGPFGC